MSGVGRAEASTGRAGRVDRIAWARRIAILFCALLVAAFAAVTTTMASSADISATPSAVRTITLVSRSYKPVGGPGQTDDYHCTLLNPQVSKDSYVISSQFVSGSPEDHHAALFLVPPSMAAEAEQANSGGKGWTCFGEAGLPNEPIADLASTPFLSVWAPGHGVDALPKGTGIELPAGSLVIMQVHYNLLVGDEPVTNKLLVETVPTTTKLQPLKLDLSFGAPDIPCAGGVTGPLCSRAASLANQGQRFGQTAVGFVDAIEGVCGRNAVDPPASDTTSCTLPVSADGYIVRAQAHMHLLGQSFRLVLNPGTPGARTVLDVPDYNFHYQKAYNLAAPIPVKTGDELQVTCTYDPTLAQELPTLRKAPPHFVTWGDGSSDEMCLGLSWISSTMPNAHGPW